MVKGLRLSQIRGEMWGEMCENGGGPEGALTPIPALDQHRTLRGSASRG